LAAGYDHRGSFSPVILQSPPEPGRAGATGAGRGLDALRPRIERREQEEKHLPMSMMPEGLANALSLEEFAALVHFLAARK
jgi:hypothetical protein